MNGAPAVIEAADLERNLDRVRAEAARPVEGVFGPDSVLWQLNREALAFLGAGRALLMQLAHPWVATAIAEHSAALENPIGRFHRTFEIAFTLVFGSLDQTLATAWRLHRRHAAVRGSMLQALGPHPEGSRYLANELSALLWVHATTWATFPEPASTRGPRSTRSDHHPARRSPRDREPG